MIHRKMPLAVCGNAWPGAFSYAKDAWQGEIINFVFFVQSLDISLAWNENKRRIRSEMSILFYK